MSFLDLFKKHDIMNAASLSEEDVIQMLKMSPGKFHEFESFYKNEILTVQEEADNLFDVNAKQASALLKGDIDISVEDIISRIVSELLNETKKIVYDGKSIEYKSFSCDVKEPVTAEEINQIPLNLRPELTGRLMKVDIKDDSYKELLWHLKEMEKEKDKKRKQFLYNHFRQGLDILDVDFITSEIIGMNLNSMSHWFPQLVDANIGKDFFKIPKTTIAKLPVPLLQLTRLDYMSLTPTTKEIVNRWAFKTFGLIPEGDYFVKTGTYSSKFDFRNCRVFEEAEINELGEYLLFIHFAALQMASPLNKPIIYGVSTTNEWIHQR